jgi:transcriptional regulator with XRE-family HTH domain
MIGLSYKDTRLKPRYLVAIAPRIAPGEAKKDIKMLSQFIQKKRLDMGMTQDFLATKLGISRPTYIQMEQGQREPKIEEAKRLAEIFGLSLDDFLNERDNQKVVINEVKERVREYGADTIRISVPQKNLKKFKEVFLYIIGKVGSKPNVGESVLNKLLYFIDFDYYEKYEEQLIGATYIKNHFGPTPCELKKIVDEMKQTGEIEEVNSKFYTFDQKKYLPHRKPDLSLFSAQEVEHIDDVLCRLSDKTAAEISNYSHGDVPWQIHKDGEPISYESVFYRDDKYSVKSYADEI